MRIRTLFTGVVLGTAVLTGGVAQAASPPAQNAAVALKGWLKVGSYNSKAACVADGENSVQQWKCVKQSSGKYFLYVWS